jgi:hypothetical protein
MKIFQPYFLDANDILLPAKWFVLAEDFETALKKAKSYFSNAPVGVVEYLVPNQQAFYLETVKEVIPKDDIFHCLG